MTVSESTIQPIRRVSALTAKLSALLDDASDGIHVSIYQSAGDSPEDGERARTLLKEHLETARQSASTEGLPAKRLDAFFSEAKELLTAGDFWEHPDAGLALFIREGETELLTVREPFDPRVVVSCQFHLKPLMALAANVDAYHLLILDEHDLRLMRGSALGIRDMETDQLPSSYADAMATLGYDADAQPDEDRQADRERLEAFVGEINDAVVTTLVDSEWPLLVAGADYFEPIYRKVNTYPHLSEAYVAGDPARFHDLEELHAQATERLKHDFIASQKRALLRLAKQDRPEDVLTDLSDVLAAAQQGRVVTLVVPHDENAWGTYDLDDQIVQRTEEPGMSSVDLYEMAARLTLSSGGEVFFLQANQIPHGADIMAQIHAEKAPAL